MGNPLIDKFYELHPEKKEESKSQKIEMYTEVSSSTLTQEQMVDVENYLKKASNYYTSTPKELKDALITAANLCADAGVSSGSLISATNSTVSAKPSKLTSYDPHSGEDVFFETAEKIKNKNAKVLSVSINRDSVDYVDYFSAGMTTMTFEVEVWNTP